MVKAAIQNKQQAKGVTILRSVVPRLGKQSRRRTPREKKPMRSFESVEAPGYSYNEAFLSRRHVYHHRVLGFAGHSSGEV